MITIINDDFRAIFGTSTPDECFYSPSGEDDYCDTAECALRSRCSLYKDVYPEPVSPEQAEQLTLQWATRMGGINTSTGNIHGGEMPRTSMEQAADAQEPENRQFTLQEIDEEIISQTVNDLVDEPWPDESPQGDEM